MDRIVKHTLQIVVLRGIDDPNPATLDLEELWEMIQTGPMIGGTLTEVAAVELDTEDEVRNELKAIGNDGTFFDEEEEWTPAGRDDAEGKWTVKCVPCRSIVTQIQKQEPVVCPQCGSGDIEVEPS